MLRAVFKSCILAALLCLPPCVAYAVPVPPVPPGLATLQTAYPDVDFATSYDSAAQDWKIVMTIPPARSTGTARTATLYWANGALLPPEELKNRAQYWTILYGYPKTIADPADFTPEQTDRVKDFGSEDSRRNGAGTPMFFFDALYDSGSKASLEQHIVRTTFLGLGTSVHERIVLPLKTVERRILDLAAQDSSIQDFVNSLKSADAYYWRIIAGTNRKSFHSLGIAIDLLPKSLGGKAIYWSWQKDRFPDTWMLTPLAQRWIPPQSIIDIFEDEGFIWGGKWAIWDNMHFEFHPELIEFNGIRK